MNCSELDLKDNFMKKFKSEGEFDIAGRGLVHVVTLTPNDLNFKNMEIVEIDEKQYFVRGIERHAISRSLTANEKVGLLVKLIDKLEEAHLP